MSHIWLGNYFLIKDLIHSFPLKYMYLVLYLTWGAEGGTGSRTVPIHFKWKSSRNAPVVEVGGHSARLDGHQVSPYTWVDIEISPMIDI